MTSTGGSGGPLTDRTGVSYNNGVKTSTYHIYAAGLDWSKHVGLLVYGDGSGEQGLVDPSDTYLMAGTNGLIAVAKKHNMILVTPRAPGNGCTDGDGVCWYLGSNDGTTRAQKTKWLDDLIKTQVLPLYNIDKTRVCIAGFSSGAENTAGIYGPAYAASWMEDGLLLAISYGSSPDQFGITDTYTAGFRANVAVVWDVRGGDETTALADSLEGYNWYLAEGFSALERNVIPGGAHDRPGEFGGIVDQYVTEHVTVAVPIGGAVAVAFRAGTDDARGTTTNAQPPAPSLVAGDQLIAIQTSDLNGSLAAMTAPAGWTEIGSGSRTDTGFMKVWTKTATSSEPSTYTFVDSTASYGSTIVLSLTGHDPTTPVIVAPTFANGAASTSHVAPSVTGVLGGMLITAALAGTAGTTRDYPSPPSGMTTAQKSSVTSGALILTGAFYQALGSSGSTGTRTATCSASTPWLTMSMVVQSPVPQTVTVVGIASAETMGAATVTVAPAPAQTITAVGIDTAEVFGTSVVSGVGSGFSGPLYPSETLFPSESLYPSDGGVPIAQTVNAIGWDESGPLGVPAVSVVTPPDQTIAVIGIVSGETFGTPSFSVVGGPQIVGPTPIDSDEAFGVPDISVPPITQTAFVFGIDTGEAFGRPTVTVSFVEPSVGPTYHDTYFLDGIDLSSLVSQIEVAEGLQDVMGTVGDNVVLPGLDGELTVFGAPGQPRRTDGPGRITLSMWMVGVDPTTGEISTGGGAEQPADDWQREWDKVVRLFRRRQLTIDHPRPDGVRRAIAHYAIGESMEPTDRRGGSPWFGRFKAVLTIPGAHWTDVDAVTTGQQSLTNNASLSLGNFAGATAPCTELLITFGPGNNPRLSTSYGHIGYNGTIAPGQQLVINTATGTLSIGSGSSWSPNYANLTFAPGPRLFEIDPSENLYATLTHTGGGSMTVEVSGKRRYRTS